MPLASIPTPGHAAWRLGPLSVRAYALCVIAGIIVAVVVASRRYRRSGGQPGIILDVAAWAVPSGLAGALVHAVLLETRHDFSHGYRLWHAATAGVAAIGIPGAVALGAVGAWVACRRAGIRLARPADGEPGPDVGEGGDSAAQTSGLGLTGRELEVLRLVAAGRSKREIAGELFISPKTASVHVSNILGKLGAASRGEAAATAHSLRLFDPASTG